MMPKHYHDCENCPFECAYPDYCEMRHCSKKLPEPPLRIINEIREVRGASYDA